MLEQRGLPAHGAPVAQRMFVHAWEQEPERNPAWAVTQGGKLVVFIRTRSAARYTQSAGQSLDMLAAGMTNS